jgi:hypothetical protein
VSELYAALAEREIGIAEARRALTPEGAAELRATLVEALATTG